MATIFGRSAIFCGQTKKYESADGIIRSILSGNCYKVRLMLASLDVPFEIVWIDTLRAESQTDSFLTINPNSRLQALVDGAFVLPESNAILHYLADGTEYLLEG